MTGDIIKQCEGGRRLPIIGAALIAVWLIDLVVITRADVLDNWTTNQITTNSVGLKHIVYGNSLYVATGELGDGGDIYSSEDGFNWTLRFSDGNSWGLTLNYSDGHFCGVGGWGTVIVSADGTNWNSGSIPPVYFDYGPANPNGQSITYGNGRYVTVGDTNGVGNIVTSADGNTWIPSRIVPAPGGRIANVAYGNGQFVAIGNNDGLEYTSSGFFAWNRRSIPGGNTISYANGLFIVPLNTKTNLVSTDGISWSPNATGVTNTIGTVTYSHGLFMAQCGGLLATSIDGTNWIQYATPLPNSWFGGDVSLATDGARLAAVGSMVNGIYNYDSYIYTSEVLVGIELTKSPSQQIILSGLIGRNYQIESADELTTGSNNWRTNVTLQLPSTHFFWSDPAATNSQRFYRAALLP
jgi:hypothetical protein